MKTIWKYELTPIDWQHVAMPAGATALSVQVQHDKLCLWALVDPDAKKEVRGISIYGTGHQVNLTHDDVFVGTVQLHNGDLVFHVFISK